MGTTQLLNRSERKSSDPALPAFPAPQLPAGLETHRGCIGHIGHPQIICTIVVLKVLKLGRQDSIKSDHLRIKKFSYNVGGGVQP